MKAVITGGAGFIGSHTVDLFLDNGADVCVIDNLSHGYVENLSKDARLYVRDLRDAEAIEEIFAREKPDVLVHLAAQTRVGESVADPVNDACINIIGTLNLMEAGRRNGLRRVVYASTAAVYGEPVELPISELHPLDMISGYGVSKHAVERYLGVYQQLYGIGYCSLRYANVFGPRQDASGEGGVISIFLKACVDGIAPTIFGNGEAVRDFIYVKDIAYANFIASSAQQNGVFNIGTGIPITINGLIRELNVAFGRDVMPIYTSPRDGDILTNYMAIEKVKNQLGWIPRYTFAEGLCETLAYYNERYGR